MTRVPPTGKTREALRALFEEGTASQDPKGELMRLAMRLIVEEALEAKTRDLLGRGYYERRGEAGEGYRNGHREAGVKTAEGKVRSTPRSSAGPSAGAAWPSRASNAASWNGSKKS